MRVTKRIVSAFLLLALCFMPFSVGVAEETAPAEETVPAEPTIPTEFTVSQTDAGYSEKIGYYVTIRMTGPSKTFEIKALVVDETGKTVEADFQETVQADTDAGVTYYTIPDTGVGKVFTLRVYDDKKESCDVIVRSVSDIENVSLYKWIYNKNKAWVRYKKAGYAEGIQLKVEKSNGKKFVKYKNIKYDLDKKDFDSTKKLAKSITKIKGGQVQRITMRTYIIIDGVKKYGRWTEPIYYAAPKKATISSDDHKIMLKGLKIKGASKKIVYISKKSKKGYQKVKTLKGSTNKCTIKMFGDRELDGKRSYYVRVEYYFKKDKKTVQSVISGKGKIAVSLYNVKVGPLRLADRVS